MAGRARGQGGSRGRPGARAGTPPPAEAYPLHDFPPPFRLYGTWLEVPPKDGAPAVPLPDDLTARLSRLGPWYHGLVPMAALVLDEQVAAGAVWVAGESVPPAGLAARLGPPPGRPPAAVIHEGHAAGQLVVTDDEAVSLATPPQGPGGEWLIETREPGHPAG
jgi:hypothetical protein